MMSPSACTTADDAPKIAPKVAIDDSKRVPERSASLASKIAPKIAIDEPKCVHDFNANDAHNDCTKECR